MTDIDRAAVAAAHQRQQRAHHADLHTRINALENDLRSATRALREATVERDAARRQLAALARPAPLRGLLARFIDREARRLTAQRDQARADRDRATTAAVRWRVAALTNEAQATARADQHGKEK